jgi:dynein heavy chain 2
MVKSFRPDQLYASMTLFVCKVLGITSISPPSIKLDAVFKEMSTKLAPLLLITTPGADPSQELEEMAIRTVGQDKYFQIAMGGGQISQALSALRRCASKGQWLCLKNLHLVVSWLPVLEKELSLLLPGAHDDFRLWLTTETHDTFPIILLQQSIKLTFESPPGLKQNMLRTYENWDESFLVNNSNGTANKNPKVRSRILFILSWFHAVVQERRSFIPQGWTKFYEFSSADLRSASDVIEAASFGSNRASPDWQTIHGLLENAIYGGRVDNEFDLRVLRSYLSKYFNDTMVDSSASELFKGYTIPSSVTHGDFVKKVQTLSDIDAPLLFGLPPNADKLVQISRSNRVVDTLKSIVIASEEGNKFDRDRWANSLTPILMYWRKIVDPNKNILFATEETTSKTSDKTVTDPIQVFVNLEFKNAKALVKFVEARLKEIDEVVKGTALLTSNIQSDASALLSGLIPDKWQDKWEHGPFEKIQLWLSEIVNKTLALAQWREKSSNKTLLSQEIDLSNLFNPNIFLNALKQFTARTTSQALDDLIHLVCNVKGTKSSVSDLKCSVTLKSLLLQGCSFDGATLSDLNGEDASALTLFPTCEIAWITDKDLKEIQSKQSTQSMQVPIYFSPTREKLLTKLFVSCGYTREDEQKFILSGAALFVESFM